MKPYGAWSAECVPSAFCFALLRPWRRQRISVAACAVDQRRAKDQDATIMAKPEPWPGVYSSCARNVALRSAGDLVDQA